MTILHQEIKPSSKLAPIIECFWSITAMQQYQHLVLPDGCMDLILRFNATRLLSIEVACTMTYASRPSIPSGHSYIGVRFKPGMASAILPILDLRLTDQLVPLLSLARQISNIISKNLIAVNSVEERIMILEEAFLNEYSISNSQLAISKLVEHHGCVSKEELYETARLGERQFRRHCIAYTGVPPKTLARILRFKKVWQALQSDRKRNLAELALDCGYVDQAHMTHEFKSFAKMTPNQYQISLV